jgi:hypothetical protein
VVKTPVYVYLKKVVELMKEKHPNSTVGDDWQAFLEIFPSLGANEYIVRHGNTYKIPFEEFWQGTHPSQLYRYNNDDSSDPYDELREGGLSQPLRGGLVANTTACVEWGPNSTGFPQQPIQRIDEPRFITNWQEMGLAGPYLQRGSTDLSSGVRYEAMNLRQLQALCKNRDLRLGGAKTVAELVVLLKANDDTGEGSRDIYDQKKKVELKTLFESRGLLYNASMSVEQLRQRLRRQDQEVGEGVEETLDDDDDGDDDDEYDNMTKDQLRDRCKDRSLHYSGNTKTLRKRLRDKDADERQMPVPTAEEGVFGDAIGTDNTADNSSISNNGAVVARIGASSSSSSSTLVDGERLISEEDAADAMVESDVEHDVVRDADDESTYSIMGVRDCNLYRHREIMLEDLNEGEFDEGDAQSDNDNYCGDDEED